jgi:hypothetical protein
LSRVAKEFQYGDHRVILETGRLARQATGAVLVSMGETVVLCTVVGLKTTRPGIDFFPLTVNYQEKTYAAGKIPGGFFKREGRPSEKETLVSRLIDRPIRPLFPADFVHEVQIMASTMSFDRQNDPDVCCLIGSSAALHVSPIPFLKKHADRITHIHLKDRKLNNGPNVPWGQGDTPIKEVLQLMKREKYPFQATIEFEYTVQEGSSVLKEIGKCVQFCKEALA